MGDSYAAALRPSAPRESSDLLRARWSNGKRTGDRIAEWIHDYAQLQLRHSAELEAFIAKHVLADSVLGTFAEPWQRTANMVLEQARLATDSAKRANIEGNNAIRELSNRPEIDRLLPLIAQGNEDAIEEFQQLDLLRLNGLKSSLTSFASIEVDRAQGNMRASENAMQSWINYDSGDGIQAFVAQIISGDAPTTVSSSGGSSSAKTGPPLSGSGLGSGLGSSLGSSLGSPIANSRGPSTSTTNSTAYPESSRNPSQATVRRKASFLSRHTSSKDEPKSPGAGGLKSRVGSIFGRKKNRNKPATGTVGGSLTSHAEADAFTSPRAVPTRPPDFGPRKPSQVSMHSNLSSPAASLRQNRQRDYDDLYEPASHSQANPNAGILPTSIAPLTPTKAPKSTSPRSSSPLRESSPLRSNGLASNGLGSNGLGSNGFTTNGLSNGPVMHNPPTAQAPSSPGRTNLAPFSDPTLTGQPNAQPNGDHQPPIPPPARHSLHRVSSLSRSPSSASAAVVGRQPSQSQREPSAFRDSRVASQVFNNLAPAHHDASRDSVIPSSFVPSSAGSGSVSPVIPAPNALPNDYRNVAPAADPNSAGSATAAPNTVNDPNLPSPLAREQQDSLGPLPAPGTPFGAAGTAAAAASAQSSQAGTPNIGSPEQFWTPAQRFAPQFQTFEQANNSLLSVSSVGHGRTPTFPPMPTETGLVAAAVEFVEAEYEGEHLVKSSVRGEAVARINGPKTADSLALGILLADPNATLTPSNLLKQTSSLSFDVPFNIYSQEIGGQELVQYSASSATGRVPIKLTPIWRFESNTVRLVLSYQLSDLYVSGDEVEIQDFVITVTIAGAARAHGAQSKPVATFSREKQRVTWRFAQPQTLRRGQPATKLLCQFVTDGGKAVPGRIELKARVPTVRNSVLQLRTLSEQKDWVPVPTAVSGDVFTRLETK